MSNAEDILYKAHTEGIREDVFIESKKLREEDPKKYRFKEYVDVLEEAYKNVVKRKNKNNENI
jgi:hypothetical protein|tara:strand:+ start:107 stop:295 length:189 start_codon:yes stop_codon:yes gene_type:complete